MSGLRYVLQQRWSSGLVADHRASINYPTPHTFSIIGAERDAVTEEIARLIGDIPVFFCSHRPVVENRLQEKLVRDALPAGSDLVREWDGTWVAERWTEPIWNDEADLTQAFFAADAALSASDLLAMIRGTEWNIWAPREMALGCRFVVGTRTHGPGIVAASILGRGMLQLSSSRLARVCRS